MTSGFEHRARTVSPLATGLAFAGFLPVLLFVGHALVPGAKEFALMIPEGWLPVQGMRFLNGLNIELVFAVLGVVAMALGALIARWHMAALDAAEKQREDRLRRVQQYRDNIRIEPFIGTMVATGRDGQWISPAQERFG